MAHVAAFFCVLGLGVIDEWGSLFSSVTLEQIVA
jgi:hypothetical protein